MSFEELLGNIGLARRSKKRRHPVLVRSDIIQDQAALDPAWPTHEDWHAPAPLPIGVFLTAKRRNSSIGPTIVMGTVVRGVDYDSIVSNAELVELGQHRADILVVGDHDIVVVHL